MSRHLYLMRHGEAEAHSSASDKDRPLSAFGRRQAADAGQLLAGRGIGVVMSSTAERCRQTVAGLDLPGGPRLEFQEALYLADSDTLLQRIGEIEDDVDALLVVGHSPGLPTLASELAYDAGHGDADAQRCAFPVSSVTEIEVPCTWSELADGERGGVRIVGTVGSDELPAVC
ncbi:SixA phosphatase family protein [Raineyella fluvialis]|uniref:Phosphoglycerate mutase n=1 Tax=Raineyella fluvialis TaxID=2662261 RepID=A0A5Q2FEP5_9ACTN|nr:histidine phosphatase family protein [Raineyella fluvialis]QGF22756.1 phosphoglycerate mutase [Raineyella fluvialis]